MPEQAPAETAENTDTPETPNPATDEDGDQNQTVPGNPEGGPDVSGLKNALASERELRKQAERQARRTKALEAELEQLRDQGRSEAEKQLAKAVKDADTKARGEARREMGVRLARAELRSEAAGKVADIDAVLDDLDLTRYVDTDGEPDVKAIRQAVARFAKLAPADKPAPPFPGGPRQTAPAGDMNTLIRRQAGL